MFSARSPIDPEGLKASGSEILTQNASDSVQHYILWPLDGKCRDGQAACRRLKHDCSKSIGTTWEDENVG